MLNSTHYASYICICLTYVLKVNIYYETEHFFGMWDLSSPMRDQTHVLCSGVLATGPPRKS